MITNRTARIAAKATMNLLARHPGVSLEAVEGSPLDLMVDASTGVSPMGGVSMESIMDDVRDTSMVANLGDGSEHDLVMEESVPPVAAQLKQTADFAREVLAPSADQIDNHVREALSNYSPVRFFVEPYFVNDIFTAQALAESVGRFSEAAESPLVRIVLPAMQEADLVSMLSTGMGQWDTMVSEWLASKPSGWLTEIYGRLFGVNYDTNMIADHQLALKASTDGQLRIEVGVGSEDSLLAAYLLATALLSRPVSVDKTLVEWQSIMATWIQQTGKRLLYFITAQARNAKLGLVGLRYPSASPIWKRNANDARIVVLGNNYNRWLEAGGSPEIIVGSLFIDAAQRPMHIQELNEMAKECAQRYENYERVLAIEVTEHSEDAIGNAVKTSFAKLISETPDEQLPASKYEVMQVAQQKLDQISNWASQDLYRFSREFLAIHIFNRPTSLHWLETIDALMEADPDLEPAQAAYMAIEDYVAKYVSNQTRVKVNPDARAVA